MNTFLSLDEKIRALTAREGQIFEMLCGYGKSHNIAEQLGLSKHTLNQHLRNIYLKLGVNSRVEAVNLFLLHQTIKLKLQSFPALTSHDHSLGLCFELLSRINQSCQNHGCSRMESNAKCGFINPPEANNVMASKVFWPITQSSQNQSTKLVCPARENHDL